MSHSTRSAPVKQILAMLESVQSSGEGWTALCPAHDDHQNSLSIGEGDDGCVLLKCHAGCDTDDILAALGLDMSDLFSRARTKHRHKSQKSGGLTLNEYAEAKRLPIKFLRKLGVGDVYVSGVTAVRIPYSNEQGQVAAARLRYSMSGDSRFTWKTGDRPCLYGLWRLPRARKKGYICLVEGESDAQTLWLNHFPALGLPGAASWKEEWAGHFERIERIYVVVEPDKGGEAVCNWLKNSKIRDRVRLVTLDGAKDPSELYLSRPKKFPRAWKKAMRRAVPWAELEEKENRAKRKAVWAKCKDLAREADILSLFADALEKRGVARETRAAKLLYLALTSRVLKRPVSAVVTGPSSGGKSFIVEQTLDFFPRSAYYDLTAMSERALVYSAEPLSHRFLVLYEGAAAVSDLLNYIIRSLLSEGRVRYETVEKTKSGLKPRLIEREGPTGLIMTSTAVRLHPENETRQLAIPVSDTPAQTKRILRAIASAHDGKGNHRRSSEDLKRWQALQIWIDCANHKVVIPYASYLADMVPPVAVRLRRDFTSIVNLIEAHAIVHQASRRVDEHGYIVAKLDDYRAVRKLVNDLVSEGVEQTVSKTIRQTVRAVSRICRENATDDEHVTGENENRPTASVLQVAKALKIDRSAALRRVNQCLTRGYLKNLETKPGPGRPHRLVPADPLPEEERVMPTAEEVRERWKGIQ